MLLRSWSAPLFSHMQIVVFFSDAVAKMHYMIRNGKMSAVIHERKKKKKKINGLNTISVIFWHLTTWH